MPSVQISMPLFLRHSISLLGTCAKRLLAPAALGATACGILAVGGPAAIAQANIYTKGFDQARTNANLDETTLTPANVNATNFGKLYTVPTDGQVYAQPLFVSGLKLAGVAHDVVLVATMSNSVYAIDAPTGKILWQQNFGTPVAASEVDISHNIAAVSGVGILSTPVIDPLTNYMYFVTANESGSTGAKVYAFHLNAIDITTGKTVHAPVNITATYSTADLLNPLVFTPLQENQRGGLALANGNVYFAFASHEDRQPYHGWVMAYNATTLQQVAVYSDTTTGIEGGIWNAGGAPNVDAGGNIYFSTGNGTFGTTTNNLVETGNSFIKLSPQLRLLDYFTPSNSAKMNAGDQDLGSSGLLLIPNTNYILGGGKQGVFYLADVNDLGKFNASEDNVRQEFQAVYGKGTSHIHGVPSYFDSDANGPSVFVWGENDVLRGFLFNTGTGLVNTTPFAKGTMTAPVTNNNGAMPGGFTSISANGKANGILWAATPFNDNAQNRSVEGVLYAFNADTLQLLWTDKTQEARDEVGLFAKYVQPVVANGRLFVATFGSLGNTAGTGQLVAYGLLPVLTVNVANVSMVSGAAVPNLTGAVAGLNAPDTLGGSVVVKYSTTATSASPVGTYPITATVSGTSRPKYKVVVNAGTLTVTAAAAASLTVAPTSAAFGEEALGLSTTSQHIMLSNGGKTTIHISSIGLTGANPAAYVTSNTCAATLAPGANCRIGVRFAPAKAGTLGASITIVDDAASSPQIITLTGTGVSPSKASVSLSSNTAAFGTQAVGQSTATQNITVTNTSGVSLFFNTLALSGANTSSYITSNTCGFGLAAGANCRIGVRFVPTTKGALPSSIVLTDNAANSPQTISLTGTGK